MRLRLESRQFGTMVRSFRNPREDLQQLLSRSRPVDARDAAWGGAGAGGTYVHVRHS